ncbi:MAG: diaminopimelate epimerase [Cyclobacteriaceae bacterium]
MLLRFVKYQGTGNDFVMIDDRNRFFDQHINLIPNLCNRRMGIGADGLILIRNHTDLDFEMVYFNADGSQSMCGNGSRCAVNFAKALGMIDRNETHFLSTDGPHMAVLLPNGEVELQLADVTQMTQYDEHELFIDTGSPHHIRFVENLSAYDVYNEGRSIRQDTERYPQGTNVNFVEIAGDQSIHVRTFERGVEDETLSCGTGVTAASLAASLKSMESPVTIHTPGGTLKVNYEKAEPHGFKNVFLTGPAEKVFDGQIEL